MVVVGGGVTGAGVVLDAASRGLRAALIERDDFASGTSSKSSKLVHGGLRYLQQGEIGLVYEALAERQRLLPERTAPGATAPLPHPDVRSRRGDPRQDRPSARLGHVGLRPDRRAAHRQAPPAPDARRGAPVHADVALGATGVGLPVLRRRGGRRTPGADAVAHRCARVRRDRRQPGRRRRGVEGRRRTCRWRGRACRRRGVHGQGPLGGQRRRGLVRRRPGDGRGHPPRLDPSREGCPHHRAVAQGPQHRRHGDPGTQGPPLGVRGAPGRVHLHRHDRHRLRRPGRRSAVHPRGHHLPAERDQRRHHRGDHRRRHRRHVGRSAAAGQGRRRADGPPTCPASTRWPGPDPGWSPSPAGSSRPTARWRRTPSTRSSPTC